MYLFLSLSVLALLSLLCLLSLFLSHTPSVTGLQCCGIKPVQP